MVSYQSKFCGSCGVPLVWGEYQEAKRSGISGWVYAILVVAVIGLVITCGLMLPVNATQSPSALGWLLPRSVDAPFIEGVNAPTADCIIRDKHSDKYSEGGPIAYIQVKNYSSETKVCSLNLTGTKQDGLMQITLSPNESKIIKIPINPEQIDKWTIEIVKIVGAQ